MQRGNMDLRWASEADSWLWKLTGIYPSIFYGRLPASVAEEGEEEEKIGRRSRLGQQELEGLSVGYDSYCFAVRARTRESELSLVIAS